METPPSRRISAERGGERYLRIHKRLVGPKTAERLFSLYGELRRGKTPHDQYSAGWAIAEASLAATQLPADQRKEYIDKAELCWVRALQLQQMNAVGRAQRKGFASANRSGEYRIATALAAAPVLAELPYGAPQKGTIHNFHRTLLLTAKLNITDMMTEQGRGLFNIATNYEGLAYEHLAQLSISRIGGRRLFACSAFARSDNGTHYPSQTHDVQILHLDRGDITSVTPTEVKRTIKTEFYSHYRDVGLLAGHDLTHNGDLSLPHALRLLEREQEGKAAPDDTVFLDAMTESTIHSIRHFQRPERYGKHCLDALRCTIDLAGAAA